ncbi:MAG: M48 family metallopeptidase, partial [Nitrospirota bacterium]
EFKTGSLLLIVPKNWREPENDLLKKHEAWIYKKHSEITKALSGVKQKTLNRGRSEDAFKAYVRQHASKYFGELKVSARALRFRQMKSKWASCTSKMITINTLLRFLPARLINYVLYHEIVHLKERKHNKRFWHLVEKNFKNIQSKEKDLMSYWFLIQKKVRGVDMFTAKEKKNLIQAGGVVSTHFSI